jgi:hypothetical protein
LHGVCIIFQIKAIIRIKTMPTKAITKHHKTRASKHPSKFEAVSLPNINAIVMRTKQIVIIVIIEAF